MVKEEKGTILRKLLKFLVQQDYKAGDRIPAERPLCETLGFNRAMLRDALKTLESIGGIEIKRGSGSYLVIDAKDLEETYVNWLITHKDRALDAHRIRGKLDLLAIELIPQESFETVYQQLKQCLNLFDVEHATADSFMAHDNQFHMIPRLASRNSVLVDICAQLSNPAFDERIVFANNPEKIKMSYNEHQAIAEAFKTGNRDFILRVQEAHLLGTEKYLANLVTDEHKNNNGGIET